MTPAERAERLFGPEPVVPGPPCACSRCSGRPEPTAAPDRGVDEAAHREWSLRWRAAREAQRAENDHAERTRLVQQMTLPWFQASVNERGGGVQPDLWDR